MNTQKSVGSAFRPLIPSISSLVKGIHKQAGAREWVTLESIALPPVPTRTLRGWCVMSLLATPLAGAKHLHVPWGFIRWSLPSGSIIQLADIRFDKALVDLRAKIAPASLPIVTTAEHSRRLQELYEHLDTGLKQESNAPDCGVLRSLYSELIPASLIPLILAIAPDTGQWIGPSTITAASEMPMAMEGKEFRVDAPEETFRSGATSQSTQESQVGVPPDLTARLAGWAASVRRVAADLGDSSTTKEIAGIEGRGRLPGVRVVFVGEPDRGKSTLINRLFGRDLVGVHSAPRVGAVTSVRAGSDPHAEIAILGQQPSRVALNDMQWDAIDAESALGNPTAVRVIVDDAWLARMDLELIDTPGVSGLTDPAFPTVENAMSRCDAVIFVVSAAIPFSLTEAALLSEQILTRGAQVGIVVTRLDGVSEKDMEEALLALRERINRISPNIPVVIAPRSVTEAPEELRSLLESLSKSSDRRLWRSLQSALHLRAATLRLMDVAHSALAMAGASDEQRAKARRDAENAAASARLKWEDLKLDLDGRRLQLLTDVRGRLVAGSDELLRNLEYELQRAPDPVMFWQRDLPHQLRRLILGESRSAAALVDQSLRRDGLWLEESAAKYFGSRSQFTAQAERDANYEVGALPDVPLDDISTQKTYARVGMGVLAIAGFFLVGPAVSVVPLLGGLGSEKLFKAKVEAQREMLGRILGDVVSRAVEQTVAELSRRIETLYRQLFTAIRREQGSWHEAQLASTREPVNEGRELVLRAAQETAITVNFEISEAIKTVKR